MDILEGLKEYFRNNTKEKILEDWETSKKYDEVGITVDEFLKSVCIECSNEGGTFGVNGWQKCSKGCDIP